MQARLTLAVLLGVVLLAAAACSSGGDDERIAELETDLEASEEALERETEQRQEAEKARKQAEDDAAEAEKKRKEEEAARKEAEAEAEEAEEDVTEAQEALEEAKDEAEEAQRRADDKIRQQAQTLEANQRAQKLLDVLEVAAFTSVAADNDRVSISVPKKNSLTFEKDRYTARTLSAPDLRGARLTRSRGGAQTVVVYTDIELSRSLIKTYDSDADATIVKFLLTDVGTVGDFNFLADEDAVVINSSGTGGHGFPSSRRLDGEGNPRVDSDSIPLDPLTKSGGSFKGSLHGVSGTFCDDADCTLTADYGDENKLNGLAITSGSPDFKPNSRTATVSLCDAPRSQCAATDAAYMAFGWWREEGTQGDYEFGPFIASGTTALVSSAPTDVKAEYNGMAVGMYVEQDQVGTAAVTKKQGEFIADARLDYDGSDLTGTIDSFKATPTGGSGAPATVGTWVVKLEGSNSAVLQRRGGNGTGTWSHQYVSDGSAVVGVFESGVKDVLHVVGAFGAQ